MYWRSGSNLNVCSCVSINNYWEIGALVLSFWVSFVHGVTFKISRIMLSFPPFLYISIVLAMAELSSLSLHYQPPQFIVPTKINLASFRTGPVKIQANTDYTTYVRTVFHKPIFETY